MHAQVLAWIGVEAAIADPAGAILEIGSLDINGSVRPLFGPRDVYHGIDLVAGPSVDEVADAADWVPPRTYDLVLCAEVLEHAPRWPDVVATMWHACEPGGRLLITCATDPRAPHSAVDGHDVRPGEHYANVSPRALLARLRDLGAAEWRCEAALGRGDLYVAATR